MPSQLLLIWWRHQMGIFSALLPICAGNSPVSGEFPAQRPVTPSFDVFFDLRLFKRLSKHSQGWWFDTHSAHYDVIVRNLNVFISNGAHIPGGISRTRWPRKKCLYYVVSRVCCPTKNVILMLCITSINTGTGYLSRILLRNLITHLIWILLNATLFLM